MAKIATTETIAASQRKRAYSVKETARELSLSVAQIYNLLNRKELHGKKSGGSRTCGRLLIEGRELDRYLDSLPPYESFTLPQLIGVKRGRKPKNPPQAAQNEQVAERA
jgi:Helix-turn-helix domain